MDITPSNTPKSLFFRFRKYSNLLRFQPSISGANCEFQQDRRSQANSEMPSRSLHPDPKGLSNSWWNAVHPSRTHLKWCDQIQVDICGKNNLKVDTSYTSHKLTNKPNKTSQKGVEEKDFSLVFWGSVAILPPAASTTVAFCVVFSAA